MTTNNEEIIMASETNNESIVNTQPESSVTVVSSDYSKATNKPSINSVTLNGNKTSSDLKLQDTLVSGTNIKTINNQSILGSGNIEIEVTSTETPDLSGKQDKIQYTIMPEASGDYDGDIVQYTGVSTSNYENGCFYKCIETTTVREESIMINQSMGLTLGEITYDLEKFRERVGTIAGIYHFLYKGYPESIKYDPNGGTDFETAITLTRDRDNEGVNYKEEKYYCWINEEEDITIFTNTFNPEEGTIPYRTVDLEDETGGIILGAYEDSSTEGRWMLWDDIEEKYVDKTYDYNEDEYKAIDMDDYGIYFEIEPLPQAEIEVDYEDESEGTDIWMWQEIPLTKGAVIDSDYVHTDNNFTDALKSRLNKLTDEYIESLINNIINNKEN